MSARRIVTQACDHVYHVVHVDHEAGEETWTVCAHPVIRRTATRLFAVRNHHARLTYEHEGKLYQEEAYALDRAKLEAGEEVEAGHHSCAFRFSLNRLMLDAYAAAQTAEHRQRMEAAEERERQWKAAAPPCLAALDLGWPCEERTLRFRYEVLCKVRRGEDVSELTRNYEEAIRYIREHAEHQERPAFGSCRSEIA